jgi:hypothetical protein
MVERVARWQESPDEGWALVRRHFPGKAVVRVVDAEAEVDYFLLLDPRDDLADMGMDGLQFTPQEIEHALAGFPSIRLPRHLQEEVKPSWATQS